jgi:phosphoglycolate phosphatase-like HAD superfamily hydrolase
MCARVAARRGELLPTIMPGVEAVLAHLEGKGALLGVATGNLEQIGWLKIENAGLRPWFRFGGFCDRFEARAEMIAHAAEQARAIVATTEPDLPRSAGTVCVVGDTPFDVESARANGLPTIAVATGRYSFEELMEHEPAACASTLEALLQASDITVRAAEHAS